MPLEQAKVKEKELLLEKFTFLNEIINILFQQQNIQSIDFYVSDQYTYLLSDYNQIEVENEDLNGAYLQMLKPAKEENYFGLQTTKFIINRKIN